MSFFVAECCESARPAFGLGNRTSACCLVGEKDTCGKVPKAEIKAPRGSRGRGRTDRPRRDPATFGIEAWVRAGRFDPDAWATDVAAWKRLGAGIAMLYPTYDLPDFASQIDLLRRFKEIVRG